MDSTSGRSETQGANSVSLGSFNAEDQSRVGSFKSKLVSERAASKRAGLSGTGKARAKGPSLSTRKVSILSDSKKRKKTDKNQEVLPSQSHHSDGKRQKTDPSTTNKYGSVTGRAGRVDLPNPDEVELQFEGAGDGRVVFDELLEQLENEPVDHIGTDDPFWSEFSTHEPLLVDELEIPAGKFQRSSVITETDQDDLNSTVDSEGTFIAESGEAFAPNLEDIPVAGLEEPTVSVGENNDADFEERKKKFQEKLEPKLGFLDKHGIETGVSVAGALAVFLGAGLFAVFPPAGVFIYAMGILALSMGLSKMLFAGDDIPQPARNEPEKAGSKDDNKSKGDGTGNDHFKVIARPDLDALAGKGADLDSKVSELEEDDDKMRRQQASKMGRVPGTPASISEAERILNSIQADILAGRKKPSTAFAEALSGILAANSDIDPDGPDFLNALGGAIGELERSMEALNKAARGMSRPSEVETKVEGLSFLKPSLSKLSSPALGKLSQTTDGFIQSEDLSMAVKGVLSAMSDLMNEMLAARDEAQADDKDLSGSGHDPLTSLKKTDKKRQAAEDHHPADRPIPINSSADFVPTANQVTFRVFAHEVEESFKKGSRDLRVNEAHKKELLEKGLEVANTQQYESTAEMSPSQQFYKDLEAVVSEQLRPWVEKLKK